MFSEIDKTQSERILVNNERLFDNDTWNHIKGFMGFIDFDNFNIRSQLRRYLSYYINQITFKFDKYKIRFNFTSVIHFGLTERFGITERYDINLFTISPREMYSIIPSIFRDYRRCRLLNETIDNPYSGDTAESRQFEKYKKYIEMCGRYARENKYVCKKNEGFLRKKYCR
jgi:hypothetical protein